MSHPATVRCSRACYEDTSACVILAPLLDLGDPINLAVYQVRARHLERVRMAERPTQDDQDG